MEIFGSNQERLWIVYGALFIFGLLYNLFVGWLEHHNYDEGYTAILVIAGVGITLVAYAFYDLMGAMRMFFAFAFSGFWMVIGSTWRYISMRRHAQDSARSK